MRAVRSLHIYTESGTEKSEVGGLFVYRYNPLVLQFLFWCTLLLLISYCRLQEWNFRNKVFGLRFSLPCTGGIYV